MHYDEKTAKKLSPETLMMGAGYNPWWSEGSVKTPLFLTSTLLFKSAEDGEEFFAVAHGLKEQGPKPPGLIYSRMNNPELQILEERLKIWEKAEDAAAFASGMAAISTLFLALCKPGDEVVYTVPVYGGTDFLFNHIAGEFGIKTYHIPAGKDFPDKLLEMKKELKNLRLVFVETPANPTIEMTDVAEVAKVCKKLSTKDREVVLAVDNTFLGPVFQQVIPLGADLSVYSATKFIGGHSDLIAGAVLGRKDLLKSIKMYRTFLGSMAQPFVCWLLLRSLETLKIRMEASAKSAQVIAEWLSKHPKVKRIYYPGMMENAENQEEICNKQCKGRGSLIAFEVKGGKKAAFKVLNGVKLCKLAVSLGGTETLIEHPKTMTHSDVDPVIMEQIGITDGLIRISIGLENPDDLIEDLKQALK